MTGRRGLQGDGIGPTGLNFFSSGGRVTTVTPAYPPSYIQLATSGYSTHYNIESSSITTITFPTSMTAGDTGAYWSFRNNTGVSKTITLSSGVAYYNGLSNATSITMNAGNGMALVWTGATVGGSNSYICL